MKNELAKPIQFIKDEHGFLVGREYADELKLNQRTMTPLQQRFLDAIEKNIALEGSQYDDAIKATIACEKIADRFAAELGEWIDNKGYLQFGDKNKENKKWVTVIEAFPQRENGLTTAQLIQQFKEQSK